MGVQVEQKSLTNFCSGFCFDPQTMDWQSIMLRLDYMGQCFQTHVERRAGWVDGWVLLGECCWVFFGGCSLVGVPWWVFHWHSRNLFHFCRFCYKTVVLSHLF